ncbi:MULTISPECIES: DUF3592 domain-containing protein [unclassified Caballeronia]|uniref:DUF3592 domain-containing protein n=1 Tax=unclassified Caballeronia TaxID=2646786 RepID=UPI0020283EB1|nr:MULTISPECIES: DUF3592 domain-containing protein [unclassified Caballeronia]MDR5769106.1 DUF3592 domain-containing protein [Caballeronia sp. LZ028]
MRVVWIGGGVFAFIGAFLLLAFGASLHESSVFSANAVAVQGHVTGNTWQQSSDSRNRNGRKGYYYPEVDFTTSEGHRIKFTGSLGYGSPAYSPGDAVTVLYNPAMPEAAMIDSTAERMMTPLMLGGMGGIFALVGGALLTFALRRRRQRSWLAKYGTRVQARLERVELDPSTSINGRNPWCLEAQWQHPATNKLYIFESDSIWFDPRPYIQRNVVDVVINIDNPKQYVVDTSFLPKLG